MGDASTPSMPIPQPVLQTPNFDEVSNDFLSWVKRQPGCWVHSGIEIKDARSKDAGRSIFTTKDLDKDEELLSVPEKEVLCVKNSKAKVFLGKDQRKNDPWFCMIVVMIYEYLQGPKSKWASYFEILPTTFDTLMYWNDDELRELEGSAIINKIGKAEAEETFRTSLVPLLLKHSKFFPPAGNMPSFDTPDGLDAILSLAHRMGSLIMAYAFEMGVDDNNSPAQKAMVPLADLFNADGEDYRNVHLCWEPGRFYMVTTCPVRKGEELFNDYGELSKADLLRRYGYASYYYPNALDLSFTSICNLAGVALDDPKIKFLDSYNLLEDEYTLEPIFENVPWSLPIRLYILIQVLQASRDEFYQIKSNPHVLAQDPPFEVNKAGACFLAKLLTQRLENCSTIDEDGDLLEGFDMGDQISPNNNISWQRYKMAVEVRHGEKELANEWLSALEPLISKPEKPLNFNKRMASELTNTAKRPKNN
ncbi:hypothetical protein FQN57_006371 [Myotisia sp. PD_48]|nr:hypothetical protein FQN57_006371 [Myotisia sp. PD_48]